MENQHLTPKQVEQLFDHVQREIQNTAEALPNQIMQMVCNNIGPRADLIRLQRIEERIRDLCDNAALAVDDHRRGALRRLGCASEGQGEVCPIQQSNHPA